MVCARRVHMKALIIQMAIACCLLAAAPGATHAAERDYDTLLESEIEQLPFARWWDYLREIAAEEGVYIETSDRDYFRVYYFDEGYTPDEAFWEEFG